MSTLEAQLRASIALARLRLAVPRTDALPPAGPVSEDPDRGRAGELPAELYYQGDDLRVPLPPVLPIDETRPLSPLDLDARRLAARGRAKLVRFFAGRYSRRLGRVVRP